jgi:ATP-dependent Clp protease ATP-binding subunit ClpA
MPEDFDQALQVDVLAASLRMEHQESGDLLEFLAKKLEQSLPQNTTVTRGGWFLSKDHPVQEITVRFNDYQYQILRERQGSLTAKVMKLVRGVVLKTTEIPVHQWTDEVAQQLAQLAESSAQTRRALNKFVIG